MPHPLPHPLPVRPNPNTQLPPAAVLIQEHSGCLSLPVCTLARARRPAWGRCQCPQSFWQGQMTLVDEHPLPRFPWLAGVTQVHNTYCLPERRRDPASGPHSSNLLNTCCFLLFPPFLFVLLIVFKAVIANNGQTGCLKATAVYRPATAQEAREQNQDVSRAGFSLGAQKETRLQAPLLASGGCCRSLACGCLTDPCLRWCPALSCVCLCLHRLIFLGVSTCPHFSPSHKDTNH